MYLPLLHQYGPWVLLAAATLGFLQVTVLNRFVQRLSQRLLASELLKQAALQLPITGPLIWPLAQRTLQSVALRWLTAAVSLVYLVGAVVWFALRP
jgi:hypothetical protein